MLDIASKGGLGGAILTPYAQLLRTYRECRVPNPGQKGHEPGQYWKCSTWSTKLGGEPRVQPASDDFCLMELRATTVAPSIFELPVVPNPVCVDGYKGKPLVLALKARRKLVSVQDFRPWQDTWGQRWTEAGFESTTPHTLGTRPGKIPHTSG